MQSGQSHQTNNPASDDNDHYIIFSKGFNIDGNLQW